MTRGSRGPRETLALLWLLHRTDGTKRLHRKVFATGHHQTAGEQLPDQLL